METLEINNPFNPPAGSSCPIRRLPTELLSRLFTLVNDSVHSQLSVDDPKELTGERYANHTLPQATIPPAIRRLPCLPLSRVCRDWREVVVSTPSLWTVFAFHPGSRSPRARVWAQLTRTQDLPIDIRIHAEIFDRPKFILPTICELLLPRMYRWRSFEVRVASAAHMHEILDAIFKTGVAFAPQLTSVVLACRDDMSGYGGDPDDDNLSDYFVVFRRSAPRLKNISLVAVVVDWNQPWISSASNLTTLHFAFSNSRGHPSWTAFTNILQGAPQLKVFIFEVPWMDDPLWVELNTPPIKLLGLEQLVISLPIRLAALVLRCCYIPALKRLTLRPNCNNSVSIAPIVAPLVGSQIVTRTSSETPSSQERPCLLATVEYLCIQGNFFCLASEANALYSNLSHLTTLVLSCSVDSFIHSLFTMPGGRCENWLPQLKTLVITNFHVPVAGIRLVALHRQELGFPLKEVILRGIDMDDVPDEHLRWFQENLERFDCFV